MTAVEATLRNGNGAGSLLDRIWDVARERGLAAGEQLPPIRELAGQLCVKPTAVRDALLKAESMGLVKVLPRAGAFLRVGAPTARLAEPVDGLLLSDPPRLANGLAANGRSGLLQHEDHNLFQLLDARRLIEVELIGQACQRRRLEDLLPARRALDGLLRLSPECPRAEFVEHDIRFHLEIARLSGHTVLVAVQQTLMELLRPHLVDVPRDLQRRESANRSHVEIYEALVAGDGQAARHGMREHLSLAYDSLLHDVQQPPTEVAPASAPKRKGAAP